MSRRRQQQNLQQLVNYEVTRKQIQDKAQAKFDAIEVRIESQKKERLQREADWREAQRVRELKKKEAEETREAELRKVEAERYQKEIEHARREAEEEKVSSRGRIKTRGEHACQELKALPSPLAAPAPGGLREGAGAHHEDRAGAHGDRAHPCRAGGSCPAQEGRDGGQGQGARGGHAARQVRPGRS